MKFVEELFLPAATQVDDACTWPGRCTSSEEGVTIAARRGENGPGR